MKMTRCPEIDVDFTNQQCNQSVEDHRIAMSKWGLTLKHTLAWDEEEMLVWFTGTGYDKYMEVTYAKRTN
jgi:hypothetical protein